MFRVFIGVKADGTVTTVVKEGCGSLQPDSLLDMIEVSLSECFILYLTRPWEERA